MNYAQHLAETFNIPINLAIEIVETPANRERLEFLFALNEHVRNVAQTRTLTKMELNLCSRLGKELIKNFTSKQLNCN